MYLSIPKFLHKKLITNLINESISKNHIESDNFLSYRFSIQLLFILNMHEIQYVSLIKKDLGIQSSRQRKCHHLYKIEDNV